MENIQKNNAEQGKNEDVNIKQIGKEIPPNSLRSEITKDKQFEDESERKDSKTGILVDKNDKRESTTSTEDQSEKEHHIENIEIIPEDGLLVKADEKNMQSSDLGQEFKENSAKAFSTIQKQRNTDGKNNHISDHTLEENPKNDKDCLNDNFSCEDYSKYISYREDGTAIYIDPKTNIKYKFSETTNNWEQIEDDSGEKNPYENEHYRWCFETNQWVPKIQPNKQYSFVDGLHTYKDEDGTIFFYDESKKAWFPKIDDDFMAIYQLNYGFDKDGNQKRKVVDDDGFKIPISIKEDMAEKIQIKKTDKEDEVIDKTAHTTKRKAPEPPTWFEIAPEQNTKVYVSNLPLDITEQEFINVMSKCGLIMKDPTTQKFKIKLYVDSNGILKGDGLCDYIKVESVDLALKILDGYDVRGKLIKVQRAKFEMRGEYNPALKPKKKKKDKEKLAKLKEKLLDWRPDKLRGERSKHERVVILKNLFDPEIFNEKVELILEYQNDIREECNKCGSVKKVIIYDRHSDGVASVSMSCPEEADLVVQVMNRRFYGKRRLIAEIWDGKTKYKVDETTTEEQNRLSNWSQFLDENNKNTIEITEVKNSNETLLKNINQISHVDGDDTDIVS